MKIAIFSPFCSRITKNFFFLDSFGRCFLASGNKNGGRKPVLPGRRPCREQGFLYVGCSTGCGPQRAGGSAASRCFRLRNRCFERCRAGVRFRGRGSERHAPGFGPEHDAEFRFPIRPTSPARSPCGGAGARCAGRHAAPRRRCPFRRACSRACRSPDCLRPSNMRGLRCG